MKLNKTLAVMLAIGIIIGGASTAVAISVTNSTMQIEMFSTAVESTDLTLDSYDTKVKGKNKVDVDLQISNPDATDHEANVTVQLLDANDTVIAEKTRATGTIASGGGTYSDTFSFDQSGLVSDYDETVIIIEQTA